ncbi:MAG: hypothetical protein C0591_02490 [Marinilabiliales bacterium]|nr:MAG: hypothetical protein C0591_02490 [Marinilabiliales bacterium]
MRTEDGVLDYSMHFNESRFFTKLGRVAGFLGERVLYSLFILYYLMFDKTIPLKIRSIFMGALGYFILPTDLVADFLPLIGFTDDIALISYVIANAIEYITPEIKEKARHTSIRLLG